MVGDKYDFGTFFYVWNGKEGGINRECRAVFLASFVDGRHGLVSEDKRVWVAVARAFEAGSNTLPTRVFLFVALISQ